MSLFSMRSSEGLCTELMPITHGHGVKGLLSKLIQSVLMSILVEMDTMQTLQLNQPHILLSKRCRGEGLFVPPPPGLLKGGGDFFV